MRKVCEEMGTHAKVLSDEFNLANFQLQMGRPRREVLHDLGVRTGVDDVKALAAILIQLTVLNGLPWPGGAAPDLVLILVVAIALTGGPAEGMLTGFFAGLALDIAPPASHLVGQSALVFCLAGYAAGRLGGSLGRASWQPLGAVVLCTAGGEALSAMVGMLFGDPGVTWSAVGHVLPVSLGYDLLVCPFALYAAVVLSGWAAGGVLARGGAGPGPARAVPAAAAGAIRDTGTGRSPRLRAAAGRPGDGWIGGAGQRAGRAATQVFAARPLHLRLRGGQAGSARGGAIPRTLAARPVHMRFGHGRGGSASGGSSDIGPRSLAHHLRTDEMTRILEIGAQAWHRDWRRPVGDRNQPLGTARPRWIIQQVKPVDAARTE